MKRWPVAAALLAACLTGCTGETTATVNPQTQALERAEQAGLLREEEKKPQLLSVYEAQKLAGEQFDSESYAVAPSRETLECEVEGETHSFAVFDVSRRADGGAVGQVAVDRVTGDRYSYHGEGVLGEYDALLSEPEDTETDWAGCLCRLLGRIGHARADRRGNIHLHVLGRRDGHGLGRPRQRSLRGRRNALPAA